MSTTDWILEDRDRRRVLNVLATVESNYKAAKLLGLLPFQVRYLRENWDVVFRERPALRLVQSEAA